MGRRSGLQTLGCLLTFPAQRGSLDHMKYRTKTGRVLTDAEIEVLAEEAERGYDLKPGDLKPTRRWCGTLTDRPDWPRPTDRQEDDDDDGDEHPSR